MRRRSLLLAVAPLLLATACPGGDDVGVSINLPEQRNEGPVASPVKVEMAARGVEIEPADAGVNEGAGHFHIMVDVDCLEPGETIPNDDQHLHFGDGSTEAEIELEPGRHELCLQVGNGEHVATDLSARTDFTVE